MPQKIFIDRYRFTVEEVAKTMLNLYDLEIDCQGYEIHVDKGMLLIDVIEPASAGQAQVASEAKPEPATQHKPEPDGELGAGSPLERSDEAAGGIASQFKAEADAAADAETAASDSTEETDEEDHGDGDPFWDPGADDQAGDDASEMSESAEDQPRQTNWAQIAGILCGEVPFQKFMFATNAEEAAVKLRKHCGVESRAQIPGNEEAIRKLKDLRTEYSVWLDGN